MHILYILKTYVLAFNTFSFLHFSETIDIQSASVNVERV
jgi:hypothetical protein